MTDDRPSGSQLEQWVSIGATIVAPVTVLGALLFYFGYVTSASEYSYFGIDVDTIGLSTQDYIMRSPQTLLVPLLVLPLAAAGFLTLNAAVRGRIASAVAHAANEAKDEANEAKPDANPVRHVEHIRHVAQKSRALGLAVLTVGVVLLLAYSNFGVWALYGLDTASNRAWRRDRLLYITCLEPSATAARASVATHGQRRQSCPGGARARR